MKWTWLLGAAGACVLAVAAFEISNVSEEIPEAGIFTRTRVTEGKTTFSFIAPNGWTSSSDAAARRISLEARNPEATITMRLSTSAYPATAAKFKEQIIASGHYKDATVLEEFSASSGSGAGFGVDLRHMISEKYPMNTRVAVFAAPEGSVEVSLSAANTPLAGLHNAWTGFINSFRVEKDSPK